MKPLAIRFLAYSPSQEFETSFDECLAKSNDFLAHPSVTPFLKVLP